MREKDTHFRLGAGATEEQPSGSGADAMQRRKSHEAIEGNADYNGKQLRDASAQRGAYAVQSLALSGQLGKQLGLSHKKVQDKLEEVSEATRSNSMLTLFREDEAAALAGLYLRPQQTLDQIFREFGMSGKHAYLRNVRTDQMLGRDPAAKEGAEKDIFKAVEKVDRLLLAIEYENNAMNGDSRANHMARMKESIEDLGKAGVRLRKVVVDILDEKYTPAEPGPKAGPAAAASLTRITAETMKQQRAKPAEKK